jgi:hypothetical protein
MERQPREVSDRHGRITILPLHRFLEELWAGKVVSDVGKVKRP